MHGYICVHTCMCIHMIDAHVEDTYAYIHIYVYVCEGQKSSLDDISLALFTLIFGGKVSH